IIGEAPLCVCAHGGNYLHQKLADVTVTTLEFPSGQRGHIFVSWLHPYKEQRLVVVGDKKMVAFDDTEPNDKLVAYAHQIEWIEHKPVAKKAEPEVIPMDITEPL